MWVVSLDSSQLRILARSGSFNWAFQSSAEYWGSQLVCFLLSQEFWGQDVTRVNGSARLADRIDGNYVINIRFKMGPLAMDFGAEGTTTTEE